MEKSATLNLRIDPTLKKESEQLFSKLGISLTSAVTMFLNQSINEQALPFKPSLPKSVNADLMNDEELEAKFQKSLNDIKNGKVRNAREFFEEFEKEKGY